MKSVARQHSKRRQLYALALAVAADLFCLKSDSLQSSELKRHVLAQG